LLPERHRHLLWHDLLQRDADVHFGVLLPQREGLRLDLLPNWTGVLRRRMRDGWAVLRRRHPLRHKCRERLL
jgi:hypothetical protein